FFFASRRRHTSFSRDWSSDVCSSDLNIGTTLLGIGGAAGIVATASGVELIGVVIPSLVYMFGVGFVFANTMARTLGRFPTRGGRSEERRGGKEGRARGRRTRARRVER